MGESKVLAIGTSGLLTPHLFLRPPVLPYLSGLGPLRAQWNVKSDLGRVRLSVPWS